MSYFAFSLLNSEGSECELPYFAESRDEAKLFFKKVLMPVYNSPIPSVRSLIQSWSVVEVGRWDAVAHMLRNVIPEPVCPAAQLFTGDDDA